MANEQTLRPGEYKLTKDDQKKGGAKSVEVRRQRKKLKEGLEILLRMPSTSIEAQIELKAMGFEDEEINNQAVMVVALYQRAIKGDVAAIKLIAELIGEDPELALKKARFNYEKKLDKMRYF